MIKHFLSIEDTCRNSTGDDHWREGSNVPLCSRICAGRLCAFRTISWQSFVSQSPPLLALFWPWCATRPDIPTHRVECSSSCVDWYPRNEYYFVTHLFRHIYSTITTLNTQLGWLTGLSDLDLLVIFMLLLLNNSTFYLHMHWPMSAGQRTINAVYVVWFSVQKTKTKAFAATKRTRLILCSTL